MGAKLASLGAQDGATDGQVGGTWGPKWANMAKIADSKINSFFDASGDRFWGGFREPKWSHVGTQRGPEMDLILKAPKTKNKIKTILLNQQIHFSQLIHL